MHRVLALILDYSLLGQQLQGFLGLDLLGIFLDFIIDALAILDNGGVLELADACRPTICWCNHSTMSYTGFLIYIVTIISRTLEMLHVLVNVHAFGSFVILKEFLCMTSNL